ncbi:MAG TPA: NYN domain-containing protein [Halobacteriales archaeon]|nr:NYN domain-containing protein [Halobacteriales archaeon]
MVLRRLLGRGRDDVALLVDGPNVFRDEFDVDLADLRDAGESLGRLAVARVYFDVRAPSGLIQAAEAHGFAVRVTSGDVDVALAVDATELVTDGTVDTLAIASRDMDFKPALETAARHGVRTVVLAPGEHGRSEALPAVADEAVLLS